jgi:hypothetical protein
MSFSTPQRLQAYLNSLSPELTELRIHRRLISSLEGVHFPNNLTIIDLEFNAIQNLIGVHFPRNLVELNLNGNRFTSLESLGGVQFPDSLTSLSLMANQIGSLEGVRFPNSVTTLNLSYNQIASLEGVRFPNGLTTLNLSYNQIASLEGVHFPNSVTTLILSHNQIASLEGVHFPNGLTYLDATHNLIQSLERAQFPPNLMELELSQNRIVSLQGTRFVNGLRRLRLDTNEIDSLEGAQFPPGLRRLTLTNNRIESLERVQLPNGLRILHLGGNPVYRNDPAALAELVPGVRLRAEPDDHVIDLLDDNAYQIYQALRLQAQLNAQQLPAQAQQAEPRATVRLVRTHQEFMAMCRSGNNAKTDEECNKTECPICLEPFVDEETGRLSEPVLFHKTEKSPGVMMWAHPVHLSDAVKYKVLLCPECRAPLAVTQAQLWKMHRHLNASKVQRVVRGHHTRKKLRVALKTKQFNEDFPMYRRSSSRRSSSRRYRRSSSRRPNSWTKSRTSAASRPSAMVRHSADL